MKNPTIGGGGGGECSQKTNIEGGIAWKVGLGQFVDLRGWGSFSRKSWVVIMMGEIDIPMHTILYIYIYFLNNFFLLSIYKNAFFSFLFLFCDEISNNRYRILTSQKPE